ncbi:glycosyltransferase family protein [Mesobaculum littorinae]|uniref:hypothetical protein n=1 Tax=Mesobaculum littorinae TaxID=2486419 RepID=UPI0019D4519D|nr:hypothetical protein [Mesobaculum littorinae]
MTDGVIYVAAGKDYLDLAEQSVRSLKAANPQLEADIFTDMTPGTDLFDRVHPIPAGPTAKLASLPHSRFDRTLYLDCDTLILSPFGDLFDLLDRFQLAVAHDVRRTSELIRQGFQHATPYAFPQMNCGVLLYRTSPEMMAFLGEWQSRYTASGLKRDQPTFRDLVWSSDLRFYVLPPEFNLRRVTMLDAWEPLDVRPTIMHSHRLLQHLRGHEERFSDLGSILAVEREALDDEWAAFETAPVDEEGNGPARRFHLAEAEAARGTDLKVPDLAAAPRRDAQQPAFGIDGRGDWHDHEPETARRMIRS